MFRQQDAKILEVPCAYNLSIGEFLNLHPPYINSFGLYIDPCPSLRILQTYYSGMEGITYTS